MRYSPYYFFYEIMVQNARGMADSLQYDMSFGAMSDNTEQMARRASDLTKLLNQSQQAFIVRYYEHLHYILEHKVQPSEDCSADLILDQLENFIGAFSEDDSDITSYSKDISDFFADIYTFSSPTNVM